MTQSTGSESREHRDDDDGSGGDDDDNHDDDDDDDDNDDDDDVEFKTDGRKKTITKEGREGFLQFYFFIFLRVS